MPPTDMTSPWSSPVSGISGTNQIVLSARTCLRATIILGMSGCNTTGESAGLGALIGAGAGAAIGGIAGGWEGAAIGAGAGAIGGYLLGRAADRPGYCRYRDRYNRTYVARC